MAPILPGLSDRPDRLEAVVKAARAAGATGLWAGMLHLKDGTREHFMSVLGRHWPELVPRYEQAYRDARVPAAGLRRADDRKTWPAARSSTACRTGGASSCKPPPEPEQLSLLTLAFATCEVRSTCWPEGSAGSQKMEIARRTVPCYKHVIEKDGEKLARLPAGRLRQALPLSVRERRRASQGLEIKARFLRGEMEHLRLREFQPGLCRYVERADKAV